MAVFLLCVLAYSEISGTPDRVSRSRGLTKERRCDATFAYQQIMVDLYRIVLHYTSRYVLPSMLHHTDAIQLLLISCTSLFFRYNVSRRKVLRRIQGVSGVFGMVAPFEKTCLLHPVVGTFHTGDIVHCTSCSTSRGNRTRPVDRGCLRVISLVG
jgi:hypothetical protein